MKSHDKGNAKESKPAIPAPTNKSQPEKPVGILAFFYLHPTLVLVEEVGKISVCQLRK